MHVVGMIHYEDGAYGVSFPDFPGCTTVATDMESAIAKAAEVLAFHAEGLAEDGALPRPRNLNELQSDPDFREDAKDATLVLVPYEPPTRSVRINITLEDSLLARVDRAAAALRETRSGYLASAARLRMGKRDEHQPSKSTRLPSGNELTRDREPTDRSRPYWKGYLKLSLVSCPILLYSASITERTPFWQINRKTGHRLRSQLIDAETGEPVGVADRARGYQIANGEFVLVEDEELEALQISSTHTIEIDAFVPRSQLDQRYIDQPYYIAPSEEVGHEAFAVIREAMRAKNVIAIGRIVLAAREKPIAMEPFEKGLRATTLRYFSEVRSEAEYFSKIPDIDVQRDMLALAEHIVDSKAEDFDASRYEDRYEAAVIEMLKRKQAGLPAKSLRPTSLPSNVISLMDALKRSIRQSESTRRSAESQALKKRGRDGAESG